MRSEDMQRHTTLAVLGFAAAMLAVAVFPAAAVGQDTSATAPAPAGGVGSKPGEGSGSKPGEGSGAKPKSTSPAPAGEVGARPGEGSSPPTSAKPTPQHFEPTEKVRPDFDVAFPIDI
jgi:hypothetical protein